MPEYNADDFAKYVGGIFKENQEYKAENAKKGYAKGVVRANGIVEINGKYYTGHFDGIDDTIQPGQGCSVIFSKSSDTDVLVIGRC